MDLTLRVPHVAPKLREALCVVAHEWSMATRPTTRRLALREASGLLTALTILSLADDVAMVPGIANREGLPDGAVRAAARFAGEHFREVLGLDDTDELD